jgi:hypothetical protein
VFAEATLAFSAWVTVESILGSAASCIHRAARTGYHVDRWRDWREATQILTVAMAIARDG